MKAGEVCDFSGYDEREKISEILTGLINQGYCLSLLDEWKFRKLW
jgi:hypothetical protein